MSMFSNREVGHETETQLMQGIPEHKVLKPFTSEENGAVLV